MFSPRLTSFLRRKERNISLQPMFYRQKSIGTVSVPASFSVNLKKSVDEFCINLVQWGEGSVMFMTIVIGFVSFICACCIIVGTIIHLYKFLHFVKNNPLP